MIATRPKPKTKPKPAPPALRDLATGKILPSSRMTEDEYVAWAGEHVRAEWVDGEVVLMSPVNLEHDEIVGFLYSLLLVIAQQEDLGAVFFSEVSLRLPSQQRRRLPDLKFVSKSRAAIVHENMIAGAPDLIVEVVLPDSVARVYRDKHAEYEKAGVREYWIVDPLTQRVEVHGLRARKYHAVKESDGWLRSAVVPKFSVKPAWLWKRPLPTVVKVLKELGVKL